MDTWQTRFTQARRFWTVAEALKGTPDEEDGAKHADQLVEVLRQRTPAQYHGDQLSSRTVSKVLEQAQRFIEWADSILPSR